jgi:excinuclease UvrABC nuclease subunit
METEEMVRVLTREMHQAAENLEFERAASIRDTIQDLTARLAAAPGPSETKGKRGKR